MNNEDKDYFNGQNQADSQLNTSEWFGAIIRYFWYFGRRKFGTFYNPKELFKNALVGWLFQIIVLALIVGAVFLLYFG